MMPIPMFFLALLAFVFLVLFNIRSSKALSTIFGITLTTLVSVQYVDFISHNPIYILSLVAGYMLIGFGYTFFAWFVALKKEYSTYIKLRNDFGKTNGIDFSNSSADSVGVPDALRDDFCSLFYKLKFGFSYNMRTDALYVPVVKDNVGFVCFNGFFWVFCLLDVLVGDGFEFLILCCSRYYDSISRSIIK